MKILYIDTETTGLDPVNDSIWQLAGIISDGKREEEFDIRISPYTSQRPSPVAMKMAGITKEELYGYPSVEEAHKEFVDILDSFVNKYDKEDKLYFCGYNAEFDSDFVRNLFKVGGIGYYGSYFWVPTLDVYQLANWALVGKRDQLKNFKLTTVYEYFINKPMLDAHDAMADIKATREILNHLVTNYNLFKR